MCSIRRYLGITSENQKLIQGTFFLCLDAKNVIDSTNSLFLTGRLNVYVFEVTNNGKFN